MTSETSGAGPADMAKETKLSEWRRLWAASTPVAEVAPSSPSAIALGAASVMVVAALPVLVVGTTAPSSAGVDRVAATTAYAETRD